MNNRLLVFLHGFGFDKYNNQKTIKKLVKTLGLSDYVSLNAPFLSGRERGGYAWFDIESGTKQRMFDDGKFEKSKLFIINEIKKELKRRNLEWNDLILCGRSQGAFMSMYIGLTYSEGCKAVVSLCGKFPIKLKDSINRGIPIIWLEAKNDLVLKKEDKLSYKILQENGIEIVYLLDETSDHDNISDEAVRKIANVIKI